MDIESGTAAGRTEYKGQTYYVEYTTSCISVVEALAADAGA
jgi:hypothetical protein